MPTAWKRIALDESVTKVSRRGLALAAGRTAGTTAAATSVLAARAGIRVCAAGGLGGVHRGFAESLDESADLTVLARTPITVVSAGVRPILDIPPTLDRPETQGVAVVGYRTSRFPAFYLTDSGQELDWRLDHASRSRPPGRPGEPTSCSSRLTGESSQQDRANREPQP